MSKIKILYVEDELSLGKITSDALILNNFEVVWAKDGLEGLSHFETQSFDICIVDVMMPKMDGYTFVKEIRLKNKIIPVLFLTARTLTEDVLKGFDIGGNDYLKKPFSIEELIVRTNELVKRFLPMNEANIYNIGNYIFNYTKMELKFDEITISLTDRENELIKRLIQKKNTIVDRKQTLLELWGDDTFYNARSMDVFITKIRKYFSNDNSISIVNIRAVGYKLIVSQ